MLTIELTARHVLHGLPSPPPEVLGPFTGMNKAMYASMWGPSEFEGTGPIAAFDVLDRLDEIDLPVLITSGAHEISSPDQMREIVRRLPNGEWRLFEHSSHLQPYEEPDEYTEVLVEFLRNVEARRD